MYPTSFSVIWLLPKPWIYLVSLQAVSCLSAFDHVNPGLTVLSHQFTLPSPVLLLPPTYFKNFISRLSISKVHPVFSQPGRNDICRICIFPSPYYIQTSTISLWAHGLALFSPFLYLHLSLPTTICSHSIDNCDYLCI